MVSSNLPPVSAIEKEPSAAPRRRSVSDQPPTSPLAEPKPSAAVSRYEVPLPSMRNGNVTRTMSIPPVSQPISIIRGIAESLEAASELPSRDPLNNTVQASLGPSIKPQHPRDEASRTTAQSNLPVSEMGNGVDGPLGDEFDRTTGSHAQLAQYGKQLARDIQELAAASSTAPGGSSEKTRVSPIEEEDVEPRCGSSQTSRNPTTTSTESGKTVRGGITPGLIVETPSYPFPRMQSESYASATQHLRPLTSIQLPSRTPLTFAPQMEPPFFHPGPSTSSAASASASAAAFGSCPDGVQSTPGSHNPSEYPTPNLYELSLMLTAESGLDAWWGTVVQIMTQFYKAERVTLSVPADTSDIENVPWGQKATYNEHPEDGFSMAYLAKSNADSTIPSNSVAPSDTVWSPGNTSVASPPARPGLSSRHSFTTFAHTQEDPTRRPGMHSRSRTYHQSEAIPAAGLAGSDLNRTALEQLAATDDNTSPSWEALLRPWRTGKARVLPVLQALDYEADPLTSHDSVMGVLKRGKVIALTRTYPYLEAQDSERSAAGSNDGGARDASSRNTNPTQSDSASRKANSKTSSEREDNRTGKLKARFEDEARRPPSPRYEEYEQAPQSPWSQSPAPSPAIRADPKENPFFADAFVDESSFSPEATPADYSSIPAPEAIGVDNASTVLHIPLNHVILSQMQSSLRMDSHVGTPGPKHRKASRGGTAASTPAATEPEGERGGRLKTTPIAILSILSPVIPYPQNLRRSLDHLSMHLATTFALCRHHTALETELAGLKTKRAGTIGFGALNDEGRPIASSGSLTNLAQLNFEDLATQDSLPGSTTSPSECSGISRSAVCSPGPAPGVTDQIGASLLSERVDKQSHAASPLPVLEDGYFGIVPRPNAPKADVGSRGRPAQLANDERLAERRRARGSSVASSQASDLEMKLAMATDRSGASKDPGRTPPASGASLPREGSTALSSGIASNANAGAPAQSPSVPLVVETPENMVAKKPDLKHRHTVLHSYGADFSTTFPSLPPSSTLSLKPTPPNRSGSLSNVPHVIDMPPPSDKLKGLILDSLPAHVFVALPQTGEVVWVSSRYLSYRGLTVSDLVRDPWGSIHVEDREEYLKEWSQCLRTGEQFFKTVRIRRFDGAYRWFYARAVASRDKRGVIHHFLGSYMDIHDQRLAEIKAARQEQFAASEAKHKLLANLIPQIIFTATHTDGITTANDQWVSYTGQSFEDSLGLGFMDYVHPEDLAKCRIPLDPAHRPRSPRTSPGQESTTSGERSASQESTVNILNLLGSMSTEALQQIGPESSGSAQGGTNYATAIADLAELARKGIVKVTRDSSGRLSYTTEVRLRSKSGEYRWHLVRCVEIDMMDFGDGVSSYFGSATDINDHKLLEAKLKEAMDSKSRFLSNMSHEIRTPLIGISGMVSFLQDTELNEEQRDHTNTIQTSANSLLMIINDILDLSKVAAGMMKLKFEWFHTRALIEDVNELVSTMAIAKRLELNYIVEEDVPALVKGDKIRIRQVLLNVIGNAIKFTSEGEVFSRCKVYHVPGLARNEIMLKFDIIDTGRGFSKEEAELIFKPFSQIDGSSTRQHGGSGLGLVISRQLVELHGGTMDGTAVPNEGSTFTFTAKFGLPTEDDYPDARPSSPPPLASKAEAALGKDTLSSMPSIPEVRPRRSRASSRISEMETELMPSELPSSSSSNLSSAGSGFSRESGRSTVPSVNVGLARFSEAAKATGHDLSQVTLTMPRDRTPPGSTAESRPPLYSILIVCPQMHSREATCQHIATTIPKDVPYQITALDSAEKARKLLVEENDTRFTHVVLNLPTAEAIISLVEQTLKLKLVGEHGLNILVLSDTVQRQQVLKLAAGTGYEKLLSAPEVSFVYKPVKPSRFAAIFDPERVRDLSIDLNRSTAQRMVESQKASYLEIVKRMGNKGHKVLLVEDNMVNQKVLTKYLTKVGVGVDVAMDGVDCVDMLFSKPHGYYSLILCDLHMPRKDGYQACEEIRAWEKDNGHPAMPIIALSANVMSDVMDKCMSAGFSDYVTKPVDFIDLSRAMSKFF